MKMTNATGNSKGQANLILHYNAWFERLHLKMVSSSAMNLCYRAGHRACSLSRASPRKQLCELPKRRANASSDAAAAPSPPPATSFSGKTERSGRWGGCFCEVETVSPRAPRVRGGLGPSSFTETSSDHPRPLRR